jgi:4a-hydroxytetrahydrobiopterin dehydratase
MSREYVQIDEAQFAAMATADATGDLDPWSAADGHVRATFVLPTFTAAATLAGSVAVLSDHHDHHPSLDIRYPGRLHITMSTHVTGGLTLDDVETARAITRLAAAAGAASESVAA